MHVERAGVSSASRALEGGPQAMSAVRRGSERTGPPDAVQLARDSLEGGKPSHTYPPLLFPPEKPRAGSQHRSSSTQPSSYDSKTVTSWTVGGEEVSDRGSGRRQPPQLSSVLYDTAGLLGRPLPSLAPLNPAHVRASGAAATASGEPSLQPPVCSRVPSPAIDSEFTDEVRSVSSSTSSAYVRHRRFNNPVTAYQFVTDPYDHAREVERQKNFLSASKRLGDPFVPSVGHKALERPTRMLMGDCAAMLYRTVMRDWFEADPVVISTAEDLLVVYLNSKHVRSPKTVLAYMNAALHRSDVVQRFGLRKVPEAWDVLTDDGHLMYTFRPLWVRKRRFLPENTVIRKGN